MHERRLEFLCAAQAILWGAWIAYPGWDAFTSSSAYDWMARLMPEVAWGGLMLLLGLAQLSAAVHNHSIRLRTASALAGTLGWVLVSVAFMLGNWHSTAAVVYPFAALTELLVYTDGMTVLFRRHKDGPHAE